MKTSFFCRGSRFEVGPGGGNAAREGLRRLGGVHEDDTSERDGQVPQAAPAPARAALHRAEVPGAPILFPSDRGRTHRHFPDRHAGEHDRNTVDADTFSGRVRILLYSSYVLGCTRRVKGMGQYRFC